MLTHVNPCDEFSAKLNILGIFSSKSIILTLFSIFFTAFKLHGKKIPQSVFSPWSELFDDEIPNVKLKLSYDITEGLFYSLILTFECLW